METESSLDRDIYCPGCRYNLRGLPPGKCPECGRPFNPSCPETLIGTPNPRHPVLSAIASLPLLWSFFVIFSAQWIFILGGDGGGPIVLFIVMFVSREANLCLLLLAAILGILLLVRFVVPRKFHVLFPLVFGIVATAYALCEAFVPRFAFGDERKELFIITMALTRFSFGLWGTALLCKPSLWRAILCCAASLVVFAFPLAITWRYDYWNIITIISALPALFLLCPAFLAVALNLRRAKPFR